MTVLFSELLVPGWAEGDDAMIGLDAVTGVYGTDRAFTCHATTPIQRFSSLRRVKRSPMPSPFAVDVPSKRNVLKVRSHDKSHVVCGAESYSKMELLSRRSVYQVVRG